MPGSRMPLHGPQPREVPENGRGGLARAAADGPAATPAPSAPPATAPPVTAPAAGPTGAGPAGARAGRSRTWFVPVVPAIAAFAFGLYDVARPSLWRDEAYTLEVASRSPGQILSLLKHADAVHGAYYLWMHGVITLVGRSETAVRLPSVAATAVAAGVLAALGMRLAASSGVASPRVSGLLAGLLYAVSPMVSRYAQEARSYATVTAFAVIATYLLVSALADRRARWWAGYSAAIALAGLFNLLALLIVPAHAITVVIASRRSRAARAAGGQASGQQARPGPSIRVWGLAVGAAVVVLIPLLATAYTERAATYWLGRPGLSQVASMVTSFAGSRVLVLPAGALIVIAVCAGVTAARAPNGLLAVADVAVPWLVVPPAILLGVSQIHPLYDFRYVVFCVPAVALLTANGLGRLAGFTAGYTARRGSGPAATAASWLPSLLVVVVIAGASVGPQQALRTPWSRPDNLRKVSQILSVQARPGDAVLYVTAHARIVGQGYPAPFRKLRDVALAESPLASATLNGREVSPAVLRSRFASVSRVWIISDGGPVLPAVRGGVEAEKLALVRTMRMIGSWYTRNDLLLLYARR